MRRRTSRHLCAECGEADFCDRPLRCEEAVIECEAFRKGPKAEKGKSPGEVRAGKGASLGLCRDCSHRRVCSYLKSRGGVWHCEDYA